MPSCATSDLHKNLTENNYGRLYGDGSMQLTIGYYDAENDTIRSYNDGPQTIASARSIQDNPIHYYNIYQSGGKQVGYLVYNHFSAGATDSGTEYDDELRSVFQQFASARGNHDGIEHNMRRLVK